MKAIVQDTYGTADVLKLEDIDRPVAGNGEVLLRVHAASVFIGDWHVMAGVPYLIRMVSGLRAPKARVRGQDVAGSVEEVGKDVRQFQLGDEVFGACDGSFAEYATAQPDKLARKPANLTFDQAATVPITGSTALQGLRDVGRLQPGQKVLIIGAAALCSWTSSDRSAPIASSTTHVRTSPRRGNATTSFWISPGPVRCHTSGRRSPRGERSFLSERKGADDGSDT